MPALPLNHTGFFESLRLPQNDRALAWKREWKAEIFVAAKWKGGSGRKTGLRCGLTQWVSDRNAEKSFIPIFLPQFSCLPFPDLG